MDLTVLFQENANDIHTHQMYLCSPNRKKIHKNENWIQQAYSMKKLTQGLQSEWQPIFHS